MLKILQVRLQQYVKCELPDVQDEFRKGRGTRDQIADICRLSKKQENASKFGKLSSGHRTGKGQFSFQFQRKAMPRMFKLPHNCIHLTC